MKHAEIWLVQFSDGLGHEFKKDRPALVVESDAQILRSSIFTVIPMTSNTNNCLDEDIILTPDAENKLFKESVIKVHYIQSFDPSRFLKKIGKASDDVMSEVKEYLKIHFDL